MMTSTTSLTWGIPELDAAVGVPCPGRFLVVGARPSNGKSLFMLNLLNALYGEGNRTTRILCFWTESTPEVVYRLWAAMRWGYEQDAVLMEEWDRLPFGARDKMAAGLEVLAWTSDRIVFHPKGLPTVEDVVDAVREYRPDILLLDYFQRIRPRKGQTRFDAIAEAAAVLQRLAVEDERIVVAASQLKRRGDGVFDKYRPPHLEDFKLAGDIEENATVAIGLFRPLKKMTAQEERAVRNGEADLEAYKWPGTMAIKVLKHKYRGSAADRVFRARVEDGQIVPFSQTPVDAGDAWESDVPF